MNAWNPINRKDKDKDRAEASPSVITISDDDTDRVEASPIPMNTSDDDKDRTEASPNAMTISDDDKDRIEASSNAMNTRDDDKGRAEASHNAIESSMPIQLPSFRSLGLPEIPRISNAKIYQIASTVIGMSGMQAGKSDGDAWAMWDLWSSQAPAHFSSRIGPPAAGAREMDRGLAIIRLGQEVYEAAFPNVDEAPLREQLKFVAEFRELAIHLEGRVGKKKVDDILIAELGSDVIPLLPERPARGDKFFGAPG
ncbi:MAG: hypothetical protein Q9182_000156 [Xanthomendoza sp. 2 TL-2023]